MTDPIKWFISILGGQRGVAPGRQTQRKQKEKETWSAEVREVREVRREEKKEEAKSVVLGDSG